MVQTLKPSNVNRHQIGLMRQGEDLKKMNLVHALGMVGMVIQLFWRM